MPEITYPNRAAALRARLLSQHVAAPQKITIDGEDFWIRTALLEDRTKITDIAGLVVKANKDGSVDLSNVPMAALMAAALIVLAVDDTGAPICSPTDLQSLLASPTGGWVQQLGEACMSSMNREKPVGEASGEAAGVASPSSSPTV